MKYSQYEEDSKILEYFKERKGTLLDIGANDGITFSNSYLLIKMGWNATLVEASPIAFKKLKQNMINFENVECIECCLAINEGKHKFYHNTFHKNKNAGIDNTDLLSTIDEESYNRTSKWGDKFIEMEVYCYNFKKIEDISKFNRFEMISIDIEGLDYDILSQIDLTKYQTELVVIEYAQNNKMKKNIIDYCATHGLRNIYFKNYTNIILTK